MFWANSKCIQNDTDLYHLLHYRLWAHRHIVDPVIDSSLYRGRGACLPFTILTYTFTELHLNPPFQPFTAGRVSGWRVWTGKVSALTLPTTVFSHASSACEDYKVCVGDCVTFSALYVLKFQRKDIHIFTYMSLLHIDVTQVLKILPKRTSTYIFYTVNIITVDVLATWGARASTAMILTELNHDNWVPAS